MAEPIMTPAQKSKQRTGMVLWAAGIGIGLLIQITMLIVLPLLADRSGQAPRPTDRKYE